MELKTISKMTGDSTYKFEVDGRTASEVKIMKDNGYMELGRFKISNKIRTDGYFCGACKAFKVKEFSMPKNGSAHDGECSKLNIRDKDFGTCDKYEPKTGLFSHNPG